MVFYNEQLWSCSLILQDQGGIGIAIGEEDTLNGVVIQSLTEHGAARKVNWNLLRKKYNKGTEGNPSFSQILS